MITRRTLIGSGLAVLGTATLPHISFARGGTGKRRFIFIIQRGAADGLHSVAPVSDPGLRTARAALVDAVLAGECQNPSLVAGILALETARLSGRLDDLRPADAPWPIRRGR